MQVYEIRLISRGGRVLDTERVRECDEPAAVISELIHSRRPTAACQADWVLNYGNRIEISDLFDDGSDQEEEG